MSRSSLGFRFVIAFAALMCASAVGQNNFKVLHGFAGYPNDGMHPTGPVVFDKAGNMYGTAPGGGNQTGCGDWGCGVVYELSPDGQGSWTESILYNFCQDFDGLSCLDGSYPSAGLAVDSAGDLYGITELGGTGYESGSGGGVAFELSPPKKPGQLWIETVLYNFCSRVGKGECLDGGFGFPSQVVFDRGGDLYGTRPVGGSGHVKYGAGVVFELSPAASGWSERVLYSFCSQGRGDNCPDGFQPGGGVTFDKNGSLYGTTTYSGKYNIGGGTGGTLFKLSRSGVSWKYQLLATVPANAEPSNPEGPLSFDAAGNLYGTLQRIQGGVFRMDRNSEKISLFKFNGTDGGGPIGGLYVNPKTTVGYGTTAGGGTYGGGVVFSIDAFEHESVLYNFCSQTNCVDGSEPWITPVPDASGNLYGTTEFGGTDNEGVVFEVTP